MNKRKINHLDAESDRQIIVKKVKIPQTDILAADGTLKYDFMTSLQNITTAKIVTYLWMNQNIQKEVVNLFHGDIKPGQSGFSNKWQQTKNNVVTKISDLSLPKSITKKLTDLVPLVGNAILNWIGYHDQHIFSTSEYSKYMAVDYLDNINWTARGTIDYQQTAKNILAKEDNDLSNDHKYTLACTYCLEDEIAVLAPNVVCKYYLNSVKIDIHPMVYFWTSHITGDNTKLYNPSYYHHYNRCNNDIGINEHIFQLLIKNNTLVNRTFNEVAIEHMWAKLNEEEKTKNITSLIKELDNQDLKYSLLSNLDYEQQQEVFKECSGGILIDMFNNWLWREYFLPTALYVLDIMYPGSYLAILKKVMTEMNNNFQDGNEYLYDQYKSMFKELWSQAPKHAKDFVFTHEHGWTFQRMITDLFSWERDMDIIELLFTDLTLQQKKAVIFADNGIIHCAHLIKNNQWALLKSFIDHTLLCEEDIMQLKAKLVKAQGKKIAEYFLEQKALDKIEYFMQWAFKSKEEINQFRQDLAYVRYENTLEDIITNNKVDLIELENHFKWCTSNNPEIVNQFKSKVPRLPSGETLIHELIKLDQYALLDQFLNWCFLNDQQQIEQFKLGQISYCARGLSCILVEQDNSFELLQKFINWCFNNKQEVEEFKTWLLYPQKETYSGSVCTGWLCEDQLELADKFIKWCLTSPEEISKFKQKLMLSGDMEYIIDPARDDPQDKLSLLIKWFNPTKQTVAEFKQLFPQKECPDDFYKLLDEFIESNKSVVTNSQEGLIQEPQINGNNQDYHNNDLQDELTITTVGQEGINHLDFI